ncbi:nucleoside diphosphate kinase regulator [Sphingosinicella rhizophila]|uniref:Nucleoside diphosphate kinase regulator n=1 Tax=Sphingosinicella rhizophila TaxID=3050082 RepID=A0ABU3QCI7_9SPHN|nr:nucleoside diphosphate kinase regulator [Sphingosinicella sp. GR2756]MDT9601047.1 nucleoside diphosphate kinase regulator [Sphingosinicella sp. GR2756]
MRSTQTLGRRGAKKPAIRISEVDYDLIANFAMSLETRSPELAQTLFDEIDRARICPAGKLPLDVVRLGSEVSYLDESTNLVRRVQLVMPSEADIEEGKVSILTPIGAGLIGLRAGQSIDWPGLDGKSRVLTILDVSQAP